MGGREFRQHQLRDPALAPIPVVVVSAVSDAGVQDLGEVGYLRKPVEYGDLSAVLRRVLSPRSSEVLVVDDEPGVRKLLDVALRHRGFFVRLASGGPEAVEVYRRHGGTVD